jgi:signal transduction histidine kinase
MKLPFSRISILWKILLSTSVAITAVFAVAGWFAVDSATHATSESIEHEARASFQAYQSLWRSRTDRLASISAILSAMSDVRAAFGTGDQATIRDTAGELWSRVSDENAFFLVTNPAGRVIASLGKLPPAALSGEIPVVQEARARFPAQVSGFLARGERLYQVTVTPVYVQATQGTALINVLVAGYDVDSGVAARLKSDTGGSEYVFLSHGRVVAATLSPADAAAVAGQLGRSTGPIRARSAEYAPQITQLAGINGEPVGQLAILRSFDAASRQIAALRGNVRLLWVISMIAGLALTYVTARRIVGPIKELDSAAAEIALQNYDCQVTVRSDNELGRLARTFNAMCASIRQGREELIRSERIATIGRLGASIVHDLRNPLAAIYGGTEMLMCSQLSEAEIQRLAGNMYRASLQIQGLLQDLLDVSRGKAGQVKECNLQEIVAGVADSLTATAETRSVGIVLQFPGNLVLALDQRRIERVFLNLMGNALDAMPSGGTLTVSAAAGPDSVLVEVRDTGQGIAPEIRGRLFQPFVTAGKAGGLGLGLAMARQAVVDHGGDMWASSDPGNGACFCFRLPRSFRSDVAASAA